MTLDHQLEKISRLERRLSEKGNLSSKDKSLLSKLRDRLNPKTKIKSN